MSSQINREHKDSLYCMIFRDKASLLELYNALNGSDYREPDRLEINTLEDAVYMGMRNDLSFLVNGCMDLYEAQSTWNPNMPLRGVGYLARLYEGYIAQNRLDVYGSMRLILPIPRFVVFYNGDREIGEKETLRLSDSFPHREGEESVLECVATVININLGHNPEILSRCRKLYEYSFLIDRIRKELAVEKDRGKAIDAAVVFCIEQGILADFLRKNRAEVKAVLLTEYDEKLHIENEKKISREEGLASGIATGQSQTLKLVNLFIADGRLNEISRLNDPDFFLKSLELYHLGTVL